MRISMGFPWPIPRRAEPGGASGMRAESGGALGMRAEPGGALGMRAEPGQMPWE